MRTLTDQYLVQWYYSSFVFVGVFERYDIGIVMRFPGEDKGIRLFSVKGQ